MINSIDTEMIVRATRKSPRLLNQKTSEAEETKSKIQECKSNKKRRRVSLSENPSFFFTPRLVENVSKSANRNLNVVKGFESLRRSPRFSIRTPELSDKNTGELDKSRKRSNVVVGISRVLGKSDIDNRLMEEEVKKKRENVNNRKCIHGKENCDPTKVSKDENFLVKTNYEGILEKKLIKSVKSASQEVQGVRRSSRISNLNTDDENGPKKLSHVLTDLSNKDTSIAMKPNMGNSEKKRKIVDQGLEKNGGSLKHNNGEENCGSQGWTTDEEQALRKAYFATKPSPHFWKKVSKLVPGKSQQECFDKIHSDTATPPQARTRSRAKMTNLSPSLSGSKLLEPTDLNIKWPKRKTQKKLLAKKTMRQLVQKRSMADQGYEADLFSVLEPVTSLPTKDFSQTEVLSTPEPVSKKKGLIQECVEKSSSDQKKPVSRLRNSCQTVLVSPPVLKQVKNMALHEKYIDKLHSREARRLIAHTKRLGAKEDAKEDLVNTKNAVNLARNALVSEAKDVIRKFQELQNNVTSDDDDTQDEDDGDDNDGF